MQTKKLAILTATCALLTAGLTGCKKGVQAGGVDKIQIRAYKAGYGVDWLYELKDQFEKTFPGKEVEIVEASSLVSDSSKNEIMTPKKNEIDLYFLSDSEASKLIAQSKSILKTDKSVLLEDLTDVYNSKAIGFDGKEESETIASRMVDGFKEYCTYNGYITKWNGKMYELPWADSVLGILCNKKVLDKYGIALPLTSDEFLTAIQAIASHSATDHVYPYAWAGNNAPGYWGYLFETWFAQYSGVEKFSKFMKCEPESGDIVNEGWKVYEDEGILKALEAMYSILDINYSPDGSAGMKHTEAQTKFIKGDAAFMVDGDWVLNEMKEPREYYDLTKDCIMMKTPVISSLGTKLGLTDAELHTIVEGIDNNKDNSEIKVDVSKATDAIINKVREARCTHSSLGTTHDIVIPSYADAKDLAKQFIRFMYSNDGCRVFRNKANANLPLKYETKQSDTNTAFQQSVDAITNTSEVHMVSGAGELNDVRTLCQIYLLNGNDWAHPTTYKGMMADKYNGTSYLTPSKIYNGEIQYMQASWADYMYNGGFC